MTGGGDDVSGGIAGRPMVRRPGPGPERGPVGPNGGARPAGRGRPRLLRLGCARAAQGGGRDAVGGHDVRAARPVPECVFSDGRGPARASTRPPGPAARPASATAPGFSEPLPSRRGRRPVARRALTVWRDGGSGVVASGGRGSVRRRDRPGRPFVLRAWAGSLEPEVMAHVESRWRSGERPCRLQGGGRPSPTGRTDPTARAGTIAGAVPWPLPLPTAASGPCAVAGGRPPRPPGSPRSRRRRRPTSTGARRGSAPGIPPWARGRTPCPAG